MPLITTREADDKIDNCAQLSLLLLDWSANSGTSLHCNLLLSLICTVCCLCWSHNIIN